MTFDLLPRLLRGRSQKQTEPQVVPRDSYHGLRNLAFQSTRAQLGFAETFPLGQPWGVIMDWHLTIGTATVVAFIDGNASVYLSAGGGFIGGASHERVRKAAQKMVAVAAECQQHVKPAKTYPLPGQGQVAFYLLTDEGVFTASAPQEELSNFHHALSNLGEAGQDIITQYCLIP